MNIIPLLEKQGKPFWVISGIVLIVGIGALDFMTGYEMAFSLFYLFPISAVTWFAGKRPGVWASVASALVWFAADVAAGDIHSSHAIYFWNTTIRLSFFIIVTSLLSALQKAFTHEKELAQLDNLTGAFNTRYFSELLNLEINRAGRYGRPFTLAYFDLDNFKTINDCFGHSTGDRVITTIVKHAKEHLRKTDIVARLGGDEFAFLFPETDQVAAQAVVAKIQISLLDEMTRQQWPVTFSIGVVTCLNSLPQTGDELMQRADDLMYSVKNNGKNGVRYYSL